MIIINVHAPHNESLESDKVDYYEALTKTYYECLAHDMAVEYFNAEVCVIPRT